MDPTPPTPWAPRFPHSTRVGRIALLATASLLVACAGDPAPREQTDAVSGTTGSATPAGYPEGPYGADVGEVMPNLAWRGYVDGDGLGLATDGDYVDVELDTFRRGGARWALVHFGTVF